MMDKRLEEQLTAYALGETDDLNVAEIEALIASDDDAQRLVGEIQVIGELSAEAFAGEALGDERRDAVLAHADSKASESSVTTLPFRTPLGLKRWAAVAAVFVATLAGLVALNRSATHERLADAEQESTELSRAETDVRSIRNNGGFNPPEVLNTTNRAQGDIDSDGSQSRVELLVTDQVALGINPNELPDQMSVADTSAGVAGRDSELGTELREVLVDELEALGYVGAAPQQVPSEAPERYYGTEPLGVAGSGGFGAGGVGDQGGLAGGGGGFGGSAQRGRIELGVGETVAETGLPAPDGVNPESSFSTSTDLQRVAVAEDVRIRAHYYAPVDNYGDDLQVRVATRDPNASGEPSADAVELYQSYVPEAVGDTTLIDPIDVNALATLPDVALNGPWIVDSLNTFNIIDREKLARVNNLASITPQQQAQPQSNTETYDRVVDNPFKRAIDEPLSTFSIDVDTGSYANVRRFLRNGELPPKDAVRIEELLNYFDYEYAPPANSDPFAAHVELVECPWNDANRLMRIGLKGREVEVHTRPRANLVFLLDVSGSMKPENKLPLVRDAMQLLTKQLRPDDRVAIVTYAGNSGLVLPSTLGTEQDTILSAIGRLQSGGSTNGAAGIELAYQVAQENFFDEGVNRVILATDGDFNVGVTDRGSLDRLIEEKAKSGVFLTVLGVGEGNLKDATMEQLANNGNGQYAYLDSEREARKVLVEQVGGTLVTIAKDVKIQIDFNPQVVGAYRLIGYENRVLAARDFDDDTKDAGEIGAGHAVTALYEIVPPEATDYPNASGTQSRYVARVPAGPHVAVQQPDGTLAHELLTVKLRYKQPDGDTSTLLEIPLTAEPKPIMEASRDTRFAAAVAAFGMALRESPYRGTTNWELIANLAEDGLGDDAHGYRAEFLTLVQTARGLKPMIELATSRSQAAGRDRIELVRILPFRGGTYVAEIRTSTHEPKRFGIGEGFESFKVMEIRPQRNEVVIYSEEHRRNFTLRAAD